MGEKVILEHANLSVTDLDEAIAFFRAAFPEFRVRGRGKISDCEWDGEWLHLGTDSTYVALQTARPGTVRKGTPYDNPGFNHIAFVVPDMDEVHRRLREAGYREGLVVELHPYRRRMYYHDPDGNEYEFIQYLSDDPAKRNVYTDEEPTRPTDRPPETDGSASRPVLLLDVMGTLVHDPFDLEIPAFFDMSREELVTRQDPTAWVEFEHGAIDEPEFLRRYFADGTPVDDAALLSTTREAYRWLDGMEELLTELRGDGLELHALSNYSTWYQMIEERVGLSRYLRWSFVSCHTGVRKPAPQAFLGAARELGRVPGECLLVDNSADNCRAAEAVGMPAIVFEDARSLRQELTARGLV